MLRGAKGLKGSAIRALDGEIGSVDDLFFDDVRWTVRYLVVNTGVWLFGRKVLLSPAAVAESRWEEHQLGVRLSREQVEKSPDIDTDQPISRQQEESYSAYYGWPLYWGGGYGAAMYPGLMVGPAMTPSATAAAVEAAGETEDEGDPHLRSANEVTGYEILTTDGSLGHVDDLLVDEGSWAVRYFAVDTGNWWPGKQMLVSPRWVEEVSWRDRSVTVDLRREQIRSAPEWDPSVPVSRAYEEEIHRHYSRRGYWDGVELRDRAT